MKLEKQDKYWVIIGVIALVAILVIFIAYKSHTSAPPVTAVNTGNTTLPASPGTSQPVTVPSNDILSLGGGNYQVFAPDQTGITDVSAQDAVNQGLIPSALAGQ
jgi:hypothetical protein